MKVVAEFEFPCWPPTCKRHYDVQMYGAVDPSTWGCHLCDDERKALIKSLEDVCDYAEQYGDGGEHLYQTRVARELLAKVKT